MQFITHGPDIPDALLQAHEEGRVVFFCGAGISYPVSDHLKTYKFGQPPPRPAPFSSPQAEFAYCSF